MRASDEEVAAAREERCRVAVLAASGPMLLLAAPAVLAFEGERSLLEVTRRDSAWALVVALVFGWPVLVGVLGLRGAYARRAPGTAAFAVPAVVQALAAGAVLLVVGAAFGERARSREEPGAWAAALAAVVVIYVLLRGFRRDGWHRWAQLVAGVWLSHLAFAVALEVANPGMFAPPAAGGWIYAFGLAAAAPAMARALVR